MSGPEAAPHRELLARVERLIGSRVESSAPVTGGYTPAIRLRCRSEDGTIFVKAGSTPLTSRFLRREIHVYGRIRADFMPRVVAMEDHEDQPLLILEDLSDHRWPPPWDTTAVDSVLEQIAEMHRRPALELEPFAEVLGGDPPGWGMVAADPQPFLSLGFADERWLQQALPLLVDAERRCRTEGESFAHWDLRSDNLCLTDRGPVFVDWNHACRSDPDLDLGFFLPSLAFEGGPLPDEVLPHAPEIAAFVSGYFAGRAGLPGIPDAPLVRLVQRQQLETSLPWAIRAIGLPRVDR